MNQYDFLFNVSLNISDLSQTNGGDVQNRSIQYTYLKLVGLKAYTMYEITLSSCTTPGCGPRCASTFLTKETGTLSSNFLSEFSIKLPISTRPLILYRIEGSPKVSSSVSRAHSYDFGCVESGGKTCEKRVRLRTGRL